MEKEDIIKSAVCFMQKAKDNYITEEVAISQNVVGMKIYEDPIFGFASAEDECFQHLKEPSVIGEHFMTPKQWLSHSKTVISFFLPFSDEVKQSNTKDLVWPSEEWLHGRIEGQALLNQLSLHIKSDLIRSGYESIIPAMDQRLWIKSALNKGSPNPGVSFTSNWSERHIAFVCGLGTFGLSKGLITSKGICGRFGSIITDLYLQPDEREYTDIYEYCSQCGECASKCPVNAISIENGKDHIICHEYCDETALKYKPRYGCGKCQTGVVCESGIPKRLVSIL
jgi:epoxyqueuosine reductase